VTQKARKEAEAKTRQETKKWRIIEEKKKKKRLEYLQQLWNEVLVGNATLLEDAEGSQVMRTKYKGVTTIFSEDEVEQQPSKKAKGKKPERYCRDTGVKMEGANSWERCVHTRQNCLVYNSR